MKVAHMAYGTNQTKMACMDHGMIMDLVRIKSQAERKSTTIVKIGTHQDSSDELIYAVRIPLPMTIGVTSFREKDIAKANQIVVSAAEISLLPSQLQIEMLARELLQTKQRVQR